MKTAYILVVISIALLSVAANAIDNKPITRYAFENRFSQKAKESVDKIRMQFGDVSDDQISDILDDISFANSCAVIENNTQSIMRCKDLGFGVIPALERVMCNPDPDIRKRAVWMATWMVYIKENRKQDYTIVEEALAWLFTRMILDVDDNVRNEASIGLYRIVSLRSQRTPIPQGAIEGIWLYKLITPYSEEYSKGMKQFNQFKIPDISAEFMKIWVDYELQKIGVDASMKKKQNDDAKPIEPGK